MIAGDFNIHIDNKENNDGAKFLDLLESFDLNQHLNEMTHNKGKTLDLIFPAPLIIWLIMFKCMTLESVITSGLSAPSSVPNQALLQSQ